MAKGNLFLGTARKTIGDVVLYRRNGVQQSRVRVRHIANPKTEAQALQRNYMAPVTRFYSPLADVLERSWEGLNRSESLSAFLKENVDLARSSGWYVTKGAAFTPLPYKVSKGILAPLTYSTSELSLAETPADIKVSTISAILVSMGYEYGDQVTFIACLRDESQGDVRPIWSRFLLSSSEETNVFAELANRVTFTAATDSLQFVGVEEEIIGVALIVSKWNGSQWLRSSQFVKCDAAYLSQFTSPEARAAAIASYQGGASVVSSDVYLNGGSGSPGTTSELSVILRESTSLVQVGYVKPLEVVDVVIGEPVIIKCRNLANNAIIDCNIVVYRPGASQNGRIYVRASADYLQARAIEPSTPTAVQFTRRADEPEMVAWLTSQGYRIA